MISADFLKISGYISFIINLSIGLFVYFKNRKNLINIFFCLFSLSIAFWSVGSSLVNTIFNKDAALLVLRSCYFFAIILPPTYLHFIYFFTAQRKNKNKIIIGFYLISLILLPFLFSRFFIKGLKPIGHYELLISDPGITYYIFIGFFGFGTCLGLFTLYRAIQKSAGQRRNQLKYIFIAQLVALFAGYEYFSSVLGIKHSPPLDDYILVVYFMIMAYAILKYHLLDINLALTRAGIFAIVYTLVLGIPLGLTGWGRLWLQGLIGADWYWAPVILAILLATFGPLIYNYLRREAEKRLRSEERLYQKALLDISSTMMLIKNLDRLLKTIVLKVVDLVKVSWAAVYLKDEKAGNYLLKYQRTPVSGTTLPKELSPDSSFIRRLYVSKLPLIGEEAGGQGSGLKAGLSVPCFLDSNMIGFLLLGDKPKNRIYTIEDANTFAFLSNQTALAIENCQFHLQQRDHHHLLRVASLDRQMACMAHEIDNPNHALLGSLGSLELSLDELKENIPSDKLAYLKQKIERIRFNSSRISKMISAVRNFSKTDTGELIPVKFEWIIEGFFNILEPQLKYYGVTYTQDIPDETIWLRASKLEIEQVLVNLGTNSVQAINEIWQSGQNTPQSKKEISFKAAKKDSSILKISISDTGSGIKKELLEDIFLDFVTTKASTVGTGLGLAISRKIIQKHNGKIWAESEGENKGATFHIELPIAQDISEEEKQEAERGYSDKDKKIIF